MSQLDLHALQLFLDVVELGSVSKAAARHDMAQPSVTARIQKLERQLRLQLLERASTGSVPTRVGRQIATQSLEVLASVAALELTAATLADPDEHTLRIAATTVVTRHYLPSWLVDAQLTGTNLRVGEHSTASGAAAVRQGDAALAFLDGPAAPLGLRSEVVATHDLVPVGSPSHRLLMIRRIHSPEQLAAAPLIVQRPGSGTRDCIVGALAPLGHHGFARELASADEVRLAAISGAGIALLPAQMVADDLAAGRLGRMAVRGIEIRQPIRAAWRGNKPADPAARLLLAAVVSC